YDNLCALLGAEHVVKETPGGGGSTDVGDVSYLMPAIQASIGGASGAFHSENYRLVDRDLAYITAAKAIVMTVIDLLADDAQTGIAVKEAYKPHFTKEQYLKEWGGIE
ncbi:amidohydrolase, partial [Ruminococcaceae bacterium OttesenSCG-928-N02]|nr:amidohydrolase [Ruminococcaceae bacterium OttesenSCG-928-N02]